MATAHGGELETATRMSRSMFRRLEVEGIACQLHPWACLTQTAYQRLSTIFPQLVQHARALLWELHEILYQLFLHQRQEESSNSGSDVDCSSEDYSYGGSLDVE